MKKIVSCLFAAMLFGAGVLSGPKPGAAREEAPLELQLISDRSSVAAGGTVSYYIIYRNVLNKPIPKAWIKVQVPGDMDVVDGGGADGDGKSGVLQWNLKDIAADGTAVIPFQLKVNTSAAYNQIIELACTAGLDEQARAETANVRIHVGTEIHQPFFSGFPDGKFYPGLPLTRAETAAVIARIKNLADEGEKQAYSDVPDHHWAYRYIRMVSHAGYMSGYNGAFRPDEPVSRAELVRIMLRLRGVEAVPLAPFDDSKGHWASDAIGTARALKWIDGAGGGKFQPDGVVERQAAAKMLAAALARGPLADGEIWVTRHFPDVDPNHWSFGWIEETSSVAHESVNRGDGKEYLIRYLPEETEPF